MQVAVAGDALLFARVEDVENPLHNGKEEASLNRPDT
jgi:hypothetical protein